MDKMSLPKLIEPGVRCFLNQSLKQCHIFKEKYNNGLYNVALFLILLLIIVVVLTFKYKGKLTSEQMVQKEDDKKQYILSKIRNFKISKLKAEQDLITGLPHWTE